MRTRRRAPRDCRAASRAVPLSATRQAPLKVYINFALHLSKASKGICMWSLRLKGYELIIFLTL